MIPTAKNYFVYPDCIDGRKSFNGLTGIIRGEPQRDPRGGDVFIFVSRSRQSIKLSFCEHGGFVIYNKKWTMVVLRFRHFGLMVRDGTSVKSNCCRCCAGSNFRKINKVKEEGKLHWF